HCVSVVGYDDVAGCWICKNSWGPGWGDRGFFRIAYGEVGIDASMWGVIVGTGPTPGGAYVPLYRYWNASAGDHFYTTSWSELGNGNYGWGYEGIQCYVWNQAAGVGGEPPSSFRTGAASAMVTGIPTTFATASPGTLVTPASFATVERGASGASFA